MGAHHINLSTPQACGYCGIGYYKIEVDEPVGGGKPPINYPKASNYGIRQPTIDNRVDHWPHWLILVCDNCGNIQFFRPDQTSDPNIWGK